MPSAKQSENQSLWGSCFNRNELAGSLGDLGTIFPIAIGMIVINGLSATAVLYSVGAYYIISGLYFKTTVPVQPMKVIGAYALATAISPGQIVSAGMWMGLILLVLALTGTINLVCRAVPAPVVRGVQFAVGLLLLKQGVLQMIGASKIQQAWKAAEPFLSVQSIGPIPIGIVLGIGAVVLILLLLENRVFPAGLVVVFTGVLAGLLLGGYRELSNLSLGLHLPPLLPYGLPTRADLVLGFTVLALPQLPMTVGNAVIAQAGLNREYFGEKVAKRQTFTALAVSMGLANVLCAVIGGMPMCHGAGGLAAHYRFGARTFGSNLIIGAAFLVIGLFLGDRAISLIGLLPFSVLGSLLVFAGAQLALTVMDVRDRKDYFVVVLMVGTALATNLAIAFVFGIALSYALKSPRLKV